MSRLSIDPQIKSAHSGYRDQAIGIMSIQCKSSQLGICLETNIKGLLFGSVLLKVQAH